MLFSLFFPFLKPYQLQLFNAPLFFSTSNCFDLCPHGFVTETLSCANVKRNRKEIISRKEFFALLPFWFSHQDSLSTTLNHWLNYVNGVCYLMCCVISLIRHGGKKAYSAKVKPQPWNYLKLERSWWVSSLESLKKIITLKRRVKQVKHVETCCNSKSCLLVNGQFLKSAFYDAYHNMQCFKGRWHSQPAVCFGVCLLSVTSISSSKDIESPTKHQL